MTGKPPEGHKWVVASVVSSEPLAPGVLQGGAGAGSPVRRLLEFWDNLSEELLPRCLWRSWVWWGQVCGRGLSGWDQQTHGWWYRHERVTVSFQPVLRGHGGAISKVSSRG